MRRVIALFIALAISACSPMPIAPQASPAAASTPETSASVNSESVQQLLDEGKVLVAVSGEVNATWFNHVGTIEYANIDNSINEPMTKLADRITAKAGLTDRSEERYRLDETYAGTPTGYVLPIENVTGGVLSMFHLASIPPGALNIVVVQAYDKDAAVHTQQVMAISFDSKVSLDTLRRAAVEEGAALVFRIKDVGDVERSRGVYIAGRLPSTPFIVTTGIVDTVSKEELHGRDSGVAENVAPLAGAEAGQAFGLTGLIVGTLGSLIVGKTFDSGSATAHIIGYHVEGSKKEKHIAVGSSVSGIKPGDKIRITQGSFLSKVEVL